jgi:hypothetical protein
MIGSGMVESDMKRFNNHLTCCCYSAILWLEGHLFDADASNNAVSVFIVFYDFASDCTTVMQGRKFSFLHKDNKLWNSGKAFAGSQTAQAPLGGYPLTARLSAQGHHFGPKS